MQFGQLEFQHHMLQKGLGYLHIKNVHQLINQTFPIREVAQKTSPVCL